MCYRNGSKRLDIGVYGVDKRNWRHRREFAGIAVGAGVEQNNAVKLRERRVHPGGATQGL